mgnify:FL=1
MGVTATETKIKIPADFKACTIIEVAIANPKSLEGECRALIAKVPGACKSRAAARAACHTVASLLYNLKNDAAEPQLEIVHDLAGAPRIRRGGKLCISKVSVSHSGDWVAVALCDGADVGIDVERINRNRQTGRLSAFLGWGEELIDPIDFYARWTLWEACFKAVRGKTPVKCKEAFDILIQSTRPDLLNQAMEWSAYQGQWEEAISYALVTRGPPSSDGMKPTIVRVMEYK